MHLIVIKKTTIFTILHFIYNCSNTNKMFINMRSNKYLLRETIPLLTSDMRKKTVSVIGKFSNKKKYTK